VRRRAQAGKRRAASIRSPLKLPRLGSNQESSDPEQGDLRLFFTVFHACIRKIAVLPLNCRAECRFGGSWVLQLAGGENT
jgi:hypothetical protein